jgi:nucleoporin NUP159
VSSIVWLSNDEFLLIHTPNTPESPDMPPESIVHYVQADKGRTAFNYQLIPDPAPPFGINRVPPIHYFCRLRKWYHLDDMLIVACVASTDIGMITRSEVPLTKEADASTITNVYTMTTFAEDTRRATLPMSMGGMEDTTAIGMALDLSSKETIDNPIFGDEMEEAPFPLPAMMLLNNEGVLCGWWIVVNDALREKKIYHDLIVAEGTASAVPPVSSPPANPFSAPPPAQTSPFGGGAFSKPAAPAFGQSGMGAATATFGGTQTIGQKPSVWGGGGATQTAGATFGQSAFGASTFGKATFGSPTVPAPTSGGIGFGSTGAIGQKQSPWGAQSKTASPFGSSAAGQSGFAKFTASNTTSPFGAVSGQQSPFAKQATPSQPAFATSGTTSAPTPGTSFGMSTQPSFGSTVTIDSSTGGSTVGGKSVFGTPSQGGSSIFGKPSLPVAQSQESDMMDDDEAELPKDTKQAGSLGLGAGGFTLGTTFKPDNTKDESGDEGPKPAPTKPLFGSDFGAAIGASGQTPSIKKEPGTDSPPSIFGIPEKKDTLFGQTTPGTVKSPFSGFGLSSPAPEPPQVTSKPQPSPSPATGPSSTSASTTHRSDEEDLPPLAGSPAEAVEMPDSDEDDEVESSGAEDAPLPPDPSSTKGSSRPSWFHEDPNAATKPTQPEPPQKAIEPPSPVEDEAPLPPDPKSAKGSSRPSWFNEDPLAAAKAAQQMPPPKAPSSQPPVESPLFQPKASTTPAGLPKPPFQFAQPARDAPRSPSPQRSASTPVGKPLAGQYQRPISRPSSRAAVAPVAPTPPLPEPEPSFTASDLSDDEDERIREELEAEVEPTLTLGKFIGHQDYTSKVDGSSKTGVGAQIERVYRDINSMIDTLGLNARNLSGFIKGHSEFMKEEGRDKDDLDIPSSEDEDEWCLVEIDDLRIVENDLEKELDVSRLQEKEQKLASLRQMRKDLAKTRQKLVECRKFLEAQRSQENKEALKKAPLDPKVAAKQRELRAKYTEFQKLLVEAEEGVVTLRTKLAGKHGGRVPTVEAVEKTIRKMTAMVEEKLDDVDSLEKQMRKVGLASTDSRPSSSSRMMASLQGSQIFTPSPKRNGPSTPSKGRTFGLDDEDSESEDGVFVDSDQADIEKVRRYVDIRNRRKVLLEQLGDAIRKRGVIRTVVPASTPKVTP